MVLKMHEDESKVSGRVEESRENTSEMKERI